MHVVHAPMKNAFVLPGGKIFVFTGIFQVAQTEDEVAAVLGHEIAHQLARHSAEKVSWTTLVSIPFVLISLTLGLGNLPRMFLEMGFLVCDSIEIKLHV